MDWQQIAAIGHVMAACTALVLGAVVIGRAKGTASHRRIGAIYAVALIGVDVAALIVHREATFGPFHVLAVVSLVTVTVAIAPLLTGLRSPGVLVNHAYCMVWSYAGLVAAGCGQFMVIVADGSGATVLAVIGLSLALSGVLIFWRVPPILAKTIV